MEDYDLVFSVLYSAGVLQNSSVFFDFTSDHLPGATHGHYSSKKKNINSHHIKDVIL
jgi:hypothetical protein